MSAQFEDLRVLQTISLNHALYISLAALTALTLTGLSRFDQGMIAAAAAAIGVSLILSRRQHVVAGSGLILTVLLAVVTVAAFRAHDGLRGLVMLCFPVLVMLSALMLPFRGFGVYAIAVLGIVAGVGINEMAEFRQGIVYPRTAPTVRDIVIAEIFVGTGAMVAMLIARNMARGFRGLRDVVHRLSEAEERYRSLSDVAMEGLMLHDGGVILDCNLAFARLFGYNQPDELVGVEGPDLLLAPESQVLIRERMVQNLTGVVEIVGVRRDGSRFPAETESRTVQYQGRAARLVSMRDISERNRVANERLRLEAEQRQLEQTMVTVAKGVSARGGTEFFRDMVASLASALGADHVLIALISPDDRQRVRAEVLFTEGRILEGFEYGLSGTPCSDVFEGNACCFPRGVQGLYPKDALLTDMGVEGYAGIPLLSSDGEIIGILVVMSQRGFERESLVLQTLQIFGARAAAEIQRYRHERQLVEARDSLRALARRLDHAQELERRRIAREIHDELGQQLTGLKFELVRLAKQTGTEEGGMNGAIELVNVSIQSVRHIARQLWPALLDKVGLAAAIQWQASEVEQRSGLPIVCEVEDFAASLQVSTVAFRILQEALTNAVRHAQAKGIRVDLRRNESELVLTVRDDGVGIAAHQMQSTTSLGVLGMTERAHMIGGSLEIGREPEGGTRVTARLPLNPAVPHLSPD